jgi:hypothetical protein
MFKHKSLKQPEIPFSWRKGPIAGPPPARRESDESDAVPNRPGPKFTMKPESRGQRVVHTPIGLVL